MAKRYLITFGLSAALVVGVAAVLNIVFDPAGIYRASSNSPKEYADRLVRSPHGLFFQQDSWNERLIKLELAQRIGDADCVVIGSSHVMQVSSFRKNRALSGICDKLINLGVSGGSIEDHLALAYAITNSGQKPKKIIFGIDPWLFNFGREVRWRDAYLDKYSAALRELKWAASTTADSGSEGKLLNLLSLEYTTRSINKALMLATRGATSIKSAPDFDQEIGLTDPVLLPDASMINSREALAQSKNVTIPLGGDAYRAEGSYHDQQAIALYRKLMLYMQGKGITPVFLLTPYHHNVWADKKSRNTLNMQAVEPEARELAGQLRIQVLGSYNPEVIGCKPNEFQDFQHPSPDCLARITK